MVYRLQLCHPNLILLAFAIIIFEDLHFPSPRSYQVTHVTNHVSSIEQNYNKLENHAVSLSEARIFTSVWCRGQNHVQRLCRFRNLCFNAKIKKFLFFHDTDSIISGLPKNRFDPAVTDFTSVEDHNTQYFNYVDLPASAVGNFNLTFVEGQSLIFRRFNPENLMHVFHDDLLPIYFTLLELFDTFEEKNVSLVFADEREAGPYYYLYSNFMDPKPIFLAKQSPEKLLCFRNSYVGLNKHTTWYQYGFNKPQGTIEKDMTGITTVIKMFCHYFRKRFNVAPPNMEKKEVVLFDRLKNRKILNKNEVVAFVLSTTQRKVHIYSLENNNLIDIISAVSQCSVLIGMHGALLVLSMFLPPGGIVVELFPYAINSHVYTPYRTLSTLSGMGIIYVAWENKVLSNTVPHPDNPPEFGGIRHLSAEEQEAIISSSHVSPHLCCYNPEWLYRIYQDTVIDIPSFGIMLQKALDVQQNFSFHSEVGKIPMGSIHPDEVQNVSCITSSNDDSNQLILSWKPPWNIQFVEHNVIEYEIWCQLAGTEDVKAFITTKTYFILSKLSSEALYHIWIRSIYGGIAGPFTSNPLVCLS